MMDGAIGAMPVALFFSHNNRKPLASPYLQKLRSSLLFPLSASNKQAIMEHARQQNQRAKAADC